MRVVIFLHLEAHLLLLELVVGPVANFLRVHFGLAHYSVGQVIQIMRLRITLDLRFRSIVFICSTHMRYGRLAELFVVLGSNNPTPGRIANIQAKSAEDVVACLRVHNAAELRALLSNLLRAHVFLQHHRRLYDVATMRQLSII